MQDGEIRVLVILCIRTSHAEPHREADPKPQHRDQRKAHRGFMNQNLDPADSQSNPSVGCVEVMDPLGLGFHTRQDITLREGKKKFFHCQAARET
jgi:hypothetical protein